MPIYRLPLQADIFPHPLDADESGILAVEGDLNADRLLNAYRHGIFPWYSESEPLLWWFPDPRCVLHPKSLKVSKSMRSVLRNADFEVTFNRAFRDVITACRDIVRPGQSGSWLNDEMIDAYTALHQRGYAHSVEVWLENKLVGGLYGVGLGKMFFGESMFARTSNASKVGFVRLVEELQRKGVRLIDCQQDTPHLRSLGAITISAEAFFGHIRDNLKMCLVDERIILPA